MKIITVNLSDPFLKCLDQMKEDGMVPSRSEAIRHLMLLGWKEYIKTFEQIQAVISLRTANHDTTNGEVKVPKNGEYFDTDPLNIKTHKIIRRLE